MESLQYPRRECHLNVVCIPQLLSPFYRNIKPTKEKLSSLSSLRWSIEVQSICFPVSCNCVDVWHPVVKPDWVTPLTKEGLMPLKCDREKKVCGYRIYWCLLHGNMRLYNRILQTAFIPGRSHTNKQGPHEPSCEEKWKSGRKRIVSFRVDTQYFQNCCGERGTLTGSHGNPYFSSSPSW